MRASDVTLGLVVAAFAASCRERGRPNPEIRMVVSHQQEDAPAAQGSPGQAPVPTRLEVPAEVQKAYSGIRLRWKDSGTGREGSVEVPLGGEAPLPGSQLRVRADVFLPAFTMSADRITSTGIEPENPAARIEVSENGAELFGGWVFARFPDVHPFRHPRYSLQLEGGVRRPAPARRAPPAPPV